MANLSITLGCNARCKICHHWQHDERNVGRPSLQEWKDFIASLQGEVAPDFTVAFGGGEPLLYPQEILELIKFTAKLGFKSALATNGHAIDESYARQLSGSGLNYINLTLLSLKSATHDFLRGIPGSLDKVLQTVSYLKGSLQTSVNTVIMKPSLDDLLELTEWVCSDRQLLGINIQAIMQPFHTPFVEEWYKTEKYSFLWPDNLEKLDYVIDSLIAMKQKGYPISSPISQFVTFKSFFRNPENFVKPFKCNLADGSFFVIDSDGTVKLCPYMQPLGKITDGDFRKLWHSEYAGQARAEVGRCKRNCHHLINCWYQEE